MTLDLEQRAAYLLTHPEETGLRQLLRRQKLLVRVVHSPAFEPHRAWSVYRPRKEERGGSLLLLRLTWDQSVEPQTPGSDAPKVVDRVAYVPQSRLEAVLAQGAGIRIPFFCGDGPWGLDGETWTVDAGEYFNTSKLEWWCDGPDAWRPFIEWVRNLAALLDELVEGASE